jgi:DNA-binding MarR family transcriptional regulator
MNVTTDQICDDLMQFIQLWKTSIFALAEKQGLTPVQMSALYSIERAGELPMGKVASALHCDASNVTGIVDRLVTQGLVVRTECATDRRAKTLTLTPKGTQLTAKLHAQLPETLACNRLSAEERNSLHDIIAKLCQRAG